MLGWIMVQANDIDDLVNELRIGGQLETIGQMWLQLELAPDPPDRRFREPGLLGHRRSRPVRRVAR